MRAAALLALLGLFGCGAVPPGTGDASFATTLYPVGLVYDRQTGCQYLASAAALTPRMGRDGRQVCERAEGSL